jgi:TolA-binding protein
MIRIERLFFFILSILLLFKIICIPVVDSKNLSEEEQLIHVGIGAFDDGLYEIAEKQFSLFLRDFPHHGKVSDVSYLLGKTLLLREKWKEAKVVFSKIVQENRNFDSIDYVFFWMAQTEMKSGNPELSRRWLLSLIQNHPKFEWMDYTYYLLGCLDVEANRFSLADFSFRKVLLLSKREALLRSASFWLGMVSLKENAFEKATLYLKPLWEDSKFLSPSQRRETLLRLSEAQLKSGRFQEALQSYQTYYSQFRSDPLIPQIYFRIGYCQYLNGNLRNSVDHFKSFQSLFKESSLSLYTHYLLGEIFLSLGDYATSIKEFNQVVQTPQAQPLWGTSLLLLYWNHLQSEEMEETNRIAQRLLKLPTSEDERGLIQWLTAQRLFSEGKILDALPYYFSILNSRFREKALFQIGKGYFLENQFREALTNVDLLLLEFPNLKPLDEGLFIKGECLFHLGDTLRAFEAYDQILVHPGKNPWGLMALTQIGIYDLFLQKDEKAEELFKRILEDFPNHPLSYHAAFQLGILSEKKKELQGASHFYSLVLKGALPELLVPTYFRIGEILIKQGKEEKALASFKAALPFLSDNSAWFGILQLEIGNLQSRWGKSKDAQKSFQMAQEQSRDEEIKSAAKELLNRLVTR